MAICELNQLNLIPSDGFRIPSAPPAYQEASKETGARPKERPERMKEVSETRKRLRRSQSAPDDDDVWEEDVYRRPNFNRSRAGAPGGGAPPPSGPGGGGDEEDSDDTLSTASGDRREGRGLYKMFLHLSKPISNLNDPEKRNDASTLDRNMKHLEKVTAQNVETGLNNDIKNLLQEFRREMQWKNAEHEHQIREYADRLERLELNEKLSARAQVEKQDGVTPLNNYPGEGASADVFQKALSSMGLAVKVIERKTLFANDPFNFILMLATESNKVAHAHRLSRGQQRDMILTYIPTNSPEYSLLELCGNLTEMFAVISTYSDQVYTRAELERKINKWQLNNASHKTLNQSVVELLELLQKTHDHDFHMDKPELFRMCITRIQMERLPQAVHDALNEARMKIRRTDSMVDLTQILLAALSRYVGMKSKQGSGGAVHAVANATPNPVLAFPPPPIFALPPPPLPPVAPQAQAQGGNPKNNKKKQGGGQQDGGNNYRSNDGWNSKNKKQNKKNDKAPRFVKAWPAG
ncbi:MAG: hypothetical protein EHM77_06325, partial [Planctomycetaceae bacterium]